MPLSSILRILGGLKDWISLHIRLRTAMSSISAILGSLVVGQFLSDNLNIATILLLLLAIFILTLISMLAAHIDLKYGDDPSVLDITVPALTENEVNSNKVKSNASLP